MGFAAHTHTHPFAEVRDAAIKAEPPVDVSSELAGQLVKKKKIFFKDMFTPKGIICTQNTRTRTRPPSDCNEELTQVF